MPWIISILRTRIIQSDLGATNTLGMMDDILKILDNDDWVILVTGMLRLVMSKILTGWDTRCKLGINQTKTELILLLIPPKQGYPNSNFRG